MGNKNFLHITGGPHVNIKVSSDGGGQVAAIISFEMWPTPPSHPSSDLSTVYCKLNFKF